MAAYPLGISQLEEGRAILIQGVSCYRADRDFGYRLQKNTATKNVVLAAPKRRPTLSEDNYMFEEDREHLYLALRAAVTVAKQSRCQVLVLSDFGCGLLGHPPREVASVMYKVIFEFKEDFKAIVIVIPLGIESSSERAMSYELCVPFKCRKRSCYIGTECHRQKCAKTSGSPSSMSLTRRTCRKEPKM
jgi:uncharacterized protein (TIGR02452 family)